MDKILLIAAGIVVLVFLFYLLSKLQMRAWLSVLEKFLDQKLVKYTKDGNSERGE